MAYKTLPIIDSGEVAEPSYYQQIHENHEEFNERSEAIGMDTYPEHSVILGGPSGLVTLVLPKGALIKGTGANSSPIALLPGTDGRAIIARNRDISYEPIPSVTVTGDKVRLGI